LSARSTAGETSQIVLKKVSVRATQAGDAANVEVEHVFHSDAAGVLEGTFRFPLPDGAILTGLALWIDGKRVEGELVERDKARKVFEEIVDQMQDPALLEWEHGSTFKMRVFPIEPEKDKVVTIRYLSPLQERSSGFTFSQGTRSASGDPTPRLEVTWQGKTVFAENNVVPGRVIEVPALPAARALSEQRQDGVYTLVRWKPDWSKLPADTRPIPKNWLVVVDTSRSALEEQKLAEETLRTVLAGLPDGSRFVVMTSDIEVRENPGGFVEKSSESRADALSFVEKTTRDGATDLEAVLTRAGAMLREPGPTALIYIGDCEATWGETRPAKLAELAASKLIDTPFNAVVLGASADTELAELLAERTHGQAVRARRAEDLTAFVAGLRGTRKELRELEVSADGAATLLTSDARSLSAGDELLVLMRNDVRKPRPTQLTVRGKVSGKPVLFQAGIAPEPTRFVAERFGSNLVRHLERLERPKEEIVKASLDYQVISKYTSFLVLESEEAYAKYAIARKTKAEFGEPQVTGADLESSDAAGAEVSLTRLQPGDPEILVIAPEDAQSVRVVFPFGEAKQAAFDREANHGKGAWLVRFLVPLETGQGTYEARAEIVHRDGQNEARTVTYTVDRTAPELKVEVHPAPRRPGWLMVRVTEAATGEESDLRRVELQTPAGAILQLTAVRWGEFVGYFKNDGVPESRRLRVVGFDQALNHSSLEVELP
jgi:hypothetical protein